MVDIIGVEKFEEISKFYGGTSVYILIHRKVILRRRNIEIVKSYNGKNINHLRIKYGITSQQIKKVLSDNDVLS